MRFRSLRICGLIGLFLLVALGTFACSSAQQDEQELESSQQDQQGQQDEQDQQDQQYQEDNQYSQQGDDEGGNYGNESEENNISNGELQQGALANAAAQGQDSYGQQGVAAQSDLQEIINEMNQQNAAVENVGNQSQMSNNGVNSAGSMEMSIGGLITGLGGISAGSGLPETGSKLAYVVQAGDTLAGISQKIFGDLNRWQSLAELSGLQNPNLIYPGEVIYYQLTPESQGFAMAYENAPREEIVAESGDTLMTISQKVYGNTHDWKYIWRQNDQIINPSQLTPGSPVYYVNKSALMAKISNFKNLFEKMNKEQEELMSKIDETFFAVNSENSEFYNYVNKRV